MALDKCCDIAVPRSANQVALPVACDRTIFNRCRSSADGYGILDLGARSVSGWRAWSGGCAEAEAQWPPMRFVARDRLSDELTLGKMAGLTEISAMGSFEALAIVVVFVLAAVVVITLVQTRRR